MSKIKSHTVWLVNKGAHTNYDKAGKWGDIKEITNGRVNVFSPDNLVKDFVKKFEEGEADGDDYILISGYAILNSVATHYFLSKFGKVKVLIWNAIAEEYQLVTYYHNTFFPEKEMKS